MGVLSEEEVRAALADLEGWRVEGDSIVRDLQFPDFRGSVGFVVAIALEAESVDHHPDLDIRWNKVRVVLSTHSEGGVTAKDIDMARAVQHLAPT
ncbi:MAG: 4a-hydroxytetrahydrobiopterin dehydratase [Acidimicrobiales bacterium]